MELSSAVVDRTARFVGGIFPARCNVHPVSTEDIDGHSLYSCFLALAALY